MRLAKNPGESADLDGIFPILSMNSRAVATVDSDVCSPAIISTPFCTGTGFMKWVLMTREATDRSVGSLVVAAAIFVIDIDDVFVAKIA